jgi:hypothetical protein
VTDEDIKRTLTEFYAAVDDPGREGMFPIGIVFASSSPFMDARPGPTTFGGAPRAETPASARG